MTDPFLKELENYTPFNEREEMMVNQTINFLQLSKDAYSRGNLSGHITCNTFILNKEKTKALFLYNKRYNAHFTPGGHADGNVDLRHVALKELQEETGVKNGRLLSENLFFVSGGAVHEHVRKGETVLPHVHFDIYFLAEIDETEKLTLEEHAASELIWVSLDKMDSLDSPDYIKQRFKDMVTKLKSFK